MVRASGYHSHTKWRPRAGLSTSPRPRRWCSSPASSAPLEPFRGYANAIRNELPSAVAVLYASHLVKLGTQALDEVRPAFSKTTRAPRAPAGAAATPSTEPRPCATVPDLRVVVVDMGPVDGSAPSNREPTNLVLSPCHRRSGDGGTAKSDT